jgi:8-oxo-dGTP pyrophosphatase MutT (NUDIX family)
MRNIRAKSVCIFRHQGKVLLAEGFDPAKNEKYLSPVGGGIDFGETSADAAIREVKEELGTEAHQLKLLGVIENLFTFNGKEGHEIVFVYEASFKDQGVYQKAMLSGVETNGYIFAARWYELDNVKGGGLEIYPKGIAGML